MRARVMAGLQPRRQGLRDTAWTFLELLARPAPYIVRGVALGSLTLCLGLGAFVASADTLPDDLLYPVKVAAEQVRLALADAPEDRAAVELSIAEHRLTEAEKLAVTGRTSDALVASAVYSQHIASAAAELAPQAEGDLSTQLESRFSAQRERALSLAASLAVNVRSARASQVLAMIATSPLAPGRTQVERVAESAVTLAADLADAAEEAMASNEQIATPPPSGSPTRSETARVAALRTESPRTAGVSRATETPRTIETSRSTTVARAAETTRPTATERPHASATRDPRASDAAKATRDAAEKARAAAEKLKKALQQHEKEKSGHKGG